MFFVRLLNVTIHCHHNYIQFGFSMLHGFTRDEWKIVLNVHKFHGVHYNEFNNYFIFVFCSSSCDTFNCILIRAMTLSKKKNENKTENNTELSFRCKQLKAERLTDKWKKCFVITIDRPKLNDSCH